MELKLAELELPKLQLELELEELPELAVVQDDGLEDTGRDLGLATKKEAGCFSIFCI